MEPSAIAVLSQEGIDQGRVLAPAPRALVSAAAAGPQETPRRHRQHETARIVLLAFVLTFIIARVLVLLIMTHRMPAALYAKIGPSHTHIHHINYGIVILSFVGAYLLFQRPHGKAFVVTAILYGVGLALTFDEFGILLHLGGGYWQRVSFDAVVVVGALLGLVSVSPALARFRTRDWWMASLVVLALLAFCTLLVDSYKYADTKVPGLFQRIDGGSPP